MEITDMQESLELYIICRYLYRVGKSPLTDAQYESLHEWVLGTGELPDYVSRTYDDDPIPWDLLNRYGYSFVEEISPEISQNSAEKQAGFEFLVEDKSFSIRALKDFFELWSWFQKFPNIRKIASIKLDGNNVKSLVGSDTFILSLTRGRSSNGFDVTSAINRLYPEGVKLPEGSVVRGECFVFPSKLEELRSYYGDDIYKTPKSAAISLLRRPNDHLPVHYNGLSYVIFSCDGLSDCVSGTYQKLHSLGLSVPPYEILVGEPLEYSEFCLWISEILDKLWEVQQEMGMPADGVVIELDEFDIDTAVSYQYQDGQVAVKFSHWSPRLYQGIIKDILVEQRRVHCSWRVRIEPVTTDDGCEATTINIFNPSFLLDFGLEIGSMIEFERNAGAVNILVNGKKIKLSENEQESV